MKKITIYTDGACSGNPGPGGWGAILEYKGVRKEISGGEAETTNNRMELMGIIRALEQRPVGAPAGPVRRPHLSLQLGKGPRRAPGK